MHKTLIALSLLTAAGIGMSPLRASSHREAPLISQDPLADNTDVYAFVAPDAYAPHEGDEYDSITAEVYPRYQAQLRGFAALDFDDLITETVRLLRDDPGVRERWSAAFRHAMNQLQTCAEQLRAVDEFFDELAGRGRRLQYIEELAA